MEATGYSHPKCYLNFTYNCFEKISREHFIPEALLEVIKQKGSKVNLKGASWLNKDEICEINPRKLGSRILCKNHNNYFSENIDPEGAKFFKSLRDIYDFNANEKVFINGAYIELVMLKIFCNLLVSKNLNLNATPINQCSLKLEWKKILLGKINWPEKWGVYISTEQYFPKNIFEINPMWGRSNEINGAEFNIAGVRCILALHKPLRGDQNKFDKFFINTVYHPNLISLKRDDGDIIDFKFDWSS